MSVPEIQGQAEREVALEDEKNDLKTVSRDREASIVEGKIDDLVLDTIDAEAEYTPEQFKKLRWKIDLWLLPLMWVSRNHVRVPGVCTVSNELQLCYGTQQADKTAVSVQAVFGLKTDTHLVGQQYACESHALFSLSRQS